MSEAERLNAILGSQAPAVLRCLSPLGLDAAMPMGIPVQAAAARKTQINATIGQVTNGHGSPLPLPFMREWIDPLDEKTTFLYSPIEGHAALRDTWLARQKALAGSSAALAAPVTTHGLTHGLSILAALFADASTDVIIPDPFWENYSLVFGMHAGARVRPFPFFQAGGFNVQGLADALAQTGGRKALVILNLPGNPTGFTPSRAQRDAIVNVLTSHPGPLGVFVDDAYQGTTWEADCMERSLFWNLQERADPERLFAFKVDGATKELFFFPSRIGFLTHTATGDAATALLSKLKCVIRGTVGCPPGPSQAMVLKALQDADDLDRDLRSRMAILKARYDVLNACLEGSSVLAPFPFNSAYFALLGFRTGVDANQIRLRLIDEYSVGTIAVPSVNALRVAYCSLDTEQIPMLIERIEDAASSA